MKSSNKINKLVDKALEEKYNAPLTYVPKPNMKPSSIGTECMRKLFYSYLRVDPDSGWKALNIKMMEKGNEIHTLVRNWIREVPEFKMIDYKSVSKGTVPNHWITGKPDPEFPLTVNALAIRKAKIDDVGFVKGIEGIKDGLWIFEYKSINAKGYENYIADGPKKEHIEQASTYAFLFEKRLNEGAFDHIPELREEEKVNGVIYIYVNRESDTAEFKEFYIEKDKKVFKRVLNKIGDTLESVKEEQLPSKTEEFCKWCPYKLSCDAEYNPFAKDAV